MAISPNTQTLPATPQPAPIEPVRVFDPDAFPDQYALRVEGDCMEPEIGDGGLALIDKTMPYGPGDLVAIYITPEVRTGKYEAVLKRLIMAPMPGVTFPFQEHPDSEVSPLIICEMLKPRRQLAYRCSHILAIHRCLGPLPAHYVVERGMDATEFAKRPDARRGRAS